MTLLDDGYVAQRPGTQGAFAAGETSEDSIFNGLDVVKMIAAYRRECREPLGKGKILCKRNKHR